MSWLSAEEFVHQIQNTSDAYFSADIVNAIENIASCNFLDEATRLTVGLNLKSDPEYARLRARPETSADWSRQAGSGDDSLVTWEYSPRACQLLREYSRGVPDLLGLLRTQHQGQQDPTRTGVVLPGEVTARAVGWRITHLPQALLALDTSQQQQQQQHQRGRQAGDHHHNDLPEWRARPSRMQQGPGTQAPLHGVHHHQQQHQQQHPSSWSLPNHDKSGGVSRGMESVGVRGHTDSPAQGRSGSAVKALHSPSPPSISPWGAGGGAANVPKVSLVGVLQEELSSRQELPPAQPPLQLTPHVHAAASAATSARPTPPSTARPSSSSSSSSGAVGPVAARPSHPHPRPHHPHPPSASVHAVHATPSPDTRAAQGGGGTPAAAAAKTAAATAAPTRGRSTGGTGGAHGDGASGGSAGAGAGTGGWAAMLKRSLPPTAGTRDDDAQPSNPASSSSSSHPWIQQRRAGGSGDPPERGGAEFKEWVKSQARLSKVDHYGKVQCLSCLKTLQTYAALEQHLTAQHHGRNDPHAKMLEFSKSAAAAPSEPPKKSGKKYGSVQLGDLLNPLMSFPALPHHTTVAAAASGSGSGGSSQRQRSNKAEQQHHVGTTPKGASNTPELGNTLGVVGKKKKVVGIRVSGGGASAGIYNLVRAGGGGERSTSGPSKGAQGRIRSGGELMLNPNRASGTLVVRRRGKEREDGKRKKKKLSQLKKVILKERAVKSGKPDAVPDDADASNTVQTIETKDENVREEDPTVLPILEVVKESKSGSDGDSYSKETDQESTVRIDQVVRVSLVVRNDELATVHVLPVPCASQADILEDDITTTLNPPEESSVESTNTTPAATTTTATTTTATNTTTTTTTTTTATSTHETDSHPKDSAPDMCPVESSHLNSSFIADSSGSDPTDSRKGLTSIDGEDQNDSEPRYPPGLSRPLGQQHSTTTTTATTTVNATTITAPATATTTSSSATHLNTNNSGSCPGQQLDASAMHLIKDSKGAWSKGGESFAAVLASSENQEAVKCLSSDPAKVTIDVPPPVPTTKPNAVEDPPKAAIAKAAGGAPSTTFSWSKTLFSTAHGLNAFASEWVPPPSTNVEGDETSGVKKKKAKKVRDKSSKEPSVPVRCDICDLQCPSQITYEQHVAGVKHQKKVARQNAPPPPPPKVKTPPNTYLGAQAQIRYADQVITSELNSAVLELLSELMRFQQRAIQNDPVKGRIRKRLVFGLREVLKAVSLKRAACLVMAPNIEQIESEGGLDDLVAHIREEARERGVRIVFALTRAKLGKIMGPRARVSVAAILNYNGADDQYKKMIQLANEGREEWKNMHADAAAQAEAAEKLAAAKAEALLPKFRCRSDGRMVLLSEGKETE